MSATDAYTYVECCDRRVPLERATRVSVGSGWAHVCREGMGCTVAEFLHAEGCAGQHPDTVPCAMAQRARVWVITG